MKEETKFDAIYIWCQSVYGIVKCQNHGEYGDQNVGVVCQMLPLPLIGHELDSLIKSLTKITDFYQLPIMIIFQPSCWCGFPTK